MTTSAQREWLILFTLCLLFAIFAKTAKALQIT